MKRLNKKSNLPARWLLIAAISLLSSGCVAPQATSELQQRIDELIQIQQQQAQQLGQLQQQLASLSGQPLDPALFTHEPGGDAEQQALTSKLEQPLFPATASAAEIAALSEASGLYLEAFAAIATGQMAEAEAGFAAFIQRFPDHEYAGNANYWRAEALLSQQEPQRAETVLLEIIANPQQQNKAPAAMARLVRYYRDRDAQDKAAAMLQALSSNYPDSPELKRLNQSTETR